MSLQQLFENYIDDDFHEDALEHFLGHKEAIVELNKALDKFYERIYKEGFVSYSPNYKRCVLLPDRYKTKISDEQSEQSEQT